MTYLMETSHRNDFENNDVLQANICINKLQSEISWRTKEQEDKYEDKPKLKNKLMQK